MRERHPNRCVLMSSRSVVVAIIKNKGLVTYCQR
jgi:hypothetical protein|eukprot:COSAG01_NODE_2358_length_7838_cov_7.568807_7_plen_34_part_00